MKWTTIALIVVLTLVAVAALAALVGSQLPRDHVASRQATFPVPPDVVWACDHERRRVPVVAERRQEDRTVAGS